MDEDLKTVKFFQLADLKRALVDVPEALRLLHMQDKAPKVAYDILCVVDPHNPCRLYVAFVRGEVVYNAVDATAAATAAAAGASPARRVRTWTCIVGLVFLS